jgi:hypothetical protein
MHSIGSASPVITAIKGMSPSADVLGSRVNDAGNAVFPQQATLGIVICRRHLPS